MAERFRDKWLRRKSQGYKAPATKEAKSSTYVKGLVPLLSVLVGMLGVLSGVYSQYTSAQKEFRLKEFELTFKLKHDLYSSFMRHLTESFDSAHRSDRSILIKNIDDLQETYYSIEPFLDDDSRAKTWQSFRDFISLCYNTFDNQIKTRASQPKDEDSISFIKYKDIIPFNKYRDDFRDRLYPSLFRTRDW